MVSHRRRMLVAKEPDYSEEDISSSDMPHNHTEEVNLKSKAPVLAQSESGLNDDAFESERKRTGKFTVEHLKDIVDTSQFN